MTDFLPPPDIEAALVSYLRETAIVSDVVGKKVSTELPDDFKDEKRVQLFRRGGSAVDGNTESIDRPTVQINSFGKTKSEAMLVAQVSTIALLRCANVISEDVQLISSERLTGPEWAEDPATQTPRYITVFAVVSRSVAGA